VKNKVAFGIIFLLIFSFGSCTNQKKKIIFGNNEEIKSKKVLNLIREIKAQQKFNIVIENSGYSDVYLLKFYDMDKDDKTLVFSYYLSNYKTKRDSVEHLKIKRQSSCLVCPKANRIFKIDNYTFLPSCGLPFLSEINEQAIEDFFENQVKKHSDSTLW